jgi:hypothetical protein
LISLAAAESWPILVLRPGAVIVALPSPAITTVPQQISSPACFSYGNDSPVSADSSTFSL